MAWVHGIRRLHRAATLVVGAQLLIWTGTGFAFSWFNFDQVRGAGDREPAPLLRTDEARITVDQAVVRAGAAATVRGVELRPLLGRPTYTVSLDGKPPILVDAIAGTLRGPLTVEEASEVARNEGKGRPAVAEVALLQNERDAPDLPVPVYRVRLADARATEVFVAPSTGKILAWRNRHWRWFDRLWSLHVLGWVNRDNPAHVGLRVLGGLALLVALSGIALYLTSLGRRRAVRA
jgi:uncharacterized iron-regulated membrane protein